MNQTRRNHNLALAAWVFCTAVVFWVAHAVRQLRVPRYIPLRTAAALQAPGNPISEVSPEVLAYTNEKLHQDLEVQKVGMGIRAVIPPSPAEQYMKALRRRAADAGLDVEKLKAAPAPVPISGSTPRFLAAPPKDRQP